MTHKQHSIRCHPICRRHKLHVLLVGHVNDCKGWSPTAIAQLLIWDWQSQIDWIAISGIDRRKIVKIKQANNGHLSHLSHLSHGESTSQGFQSSVNRFASIRHHRFRHFGSLRFTSHRWFIWIHRDSPAFSNFSSNFHRVDWDPHPQADERGHVCAPHANHHTLAIHDIQNLDQTCFVNVGSNIQPRWATTLPRSFLILSNRTAASQ